MKRAKTLRPATPSELPGDMDPRMRRSIRLLCEVMQDDVAACRFGRVKRMATAATNVLEAFRPSIDYDEQDAEGNVYQMQQGGGEIRMMNPVRGIIARGGVALAHSGPEDDLRTVLGHVADAMEAARATELSQLLRALTAAKEQGRTELADRIEKRLSVIEARMADGEPNAQA